jgi:hypothetical protein
MKVLNSLRTGVLCALFITTTIGCGAVEPAPELSEQGQAVGGKCSSDADCQPGTVCEPTYRGTLCVEGCHYEWQCGDYVNTHCNLRVDCREDGSCPGLCWFLE